MHKKFTVLLATGAMLVTTIAGCAANKPYPTETVPAVEAQAVIAEPAVLATDSNLAIKPSTFTNPAIVFSGDYYSNRATLLVEANGPENVTLTVVIPNSAKTQTILTADAKFNYYTNTVTYVNGTKTLVTLNKNGKAVSEKQVYANGTGSFIFEKGSARWNDHTEKISNMTFKAGTPEKQFLLPRIQSFPRRRQRKPSGSERPLRRLPRMHPKLSLLTAIAHTVIRILRSPYTSTRTIRLISLQPRLTTMRLRSNMRSHGMPAANSIQRQTQLLTTTAPRSLS